MASVRGPGVTGGGSTAAWGAPPARADRAASTGGIDARPAPGGGPVASARGTDAPGRPFVVDGVGAGWRPEIAGWVADVPELGFCEVIAESLAPAGPPRGVVDLRERGVPVIPHGIRLSLGGAEPLDPARVTHLAACADALDAPLVSEHVAFVRAGGREAGHLLPVPRTREALDVLAANVARLSAELTVPLALEVIAALFDWPDDEFAEPEFLAALLDRTGALLLLDVANVYANAVNRGRTRGPLLDRILDLVPADRIGYVHVAGGSARHDEAGLYHDTHTDPVPDAGARPARAPGRARAGGAGAAGARRPLPARRRAHRRARRRSRRRPAHDPRAPDGESPFPGRRVSVFEHAVSGFRRTLAERQAALVAALVAGAPDPAGLRPRPPRRRPPRAAAQAGGRGGEALAGARRVPGPRWSTAFAAHHAGREPVGGLRDGWDVARALRAGAERRRRRASSRDREAALALRRRRTTAPRAASRTAVAAPLTGG